MNNIKEFKSKDSFEYYINNIITKKKLGSGTEGDCYLGKDNLARSEEHTSELQSQANISYAVFCLKKRFF